jgi:hypothetical protein
MGGEGEEEEKASSDELMFKERMEVSNSLIHGMRVSH